MVERRKQGKTNWRREEQSCHLRRAAQSASLSESEESAFRRWLRRLRPSAFPTSHLASSLGRAGTTAGRKEAAPSPSLPRSSMLSSNSAGRGRSVGGNGWPSVATVTAGGGRAEARPAGEAGRHSAGARAGETNHSRIAFSCFKWRGRERLLREVKRGRKTAVLF